MCRGMRNPHGLNVRQYTSCLIDLNKYLDLFPGEKLTDKICMTELNDIFQKKVCPLVGAIKRMCRDLNVSLLILRKLLICLNEWILWSLFTNV